MCVLWSPANTVNRTYIMINFTCYFEHVILLVTPSKNRWWSMKRERIPGPGEDGEEQSSSPSSFSGKKIKRPAVAAGFAEGGAADVLAPGAKLAGLVTAVTGPDGAVLGTLTDQEVLGVLGAAQKTATWAAWVELVTLAEFARRRPGTESGSAGARAAAEEVAWKTAEAWTRMLDQAEHAVRVAARLPQTLAAMSKGLVSAFKVRIIEAQTADLTAEDVAEADELLAQAGQERNPAALRDCARRLVTRLDAEALARRKDRARQRAHVRAWVEDSGNMGLSAREMPTGDGQIAFQNIETRALDLHAAGAEGTHGQLQVQAMLDFLLGRAVPGRGARQNAHDGESESAHQDAHVPDEEGGEDEAGARLNARTCARGGGRGGWACNPILIVPWDPALGRPSGPADLPGYGLVDADDTMDLLRTAGENPASR
jgi:hypothetical protein